MSETVVGVGAVISAYFPEQVPAGCEQQGLRPAVVVGSPEKVGEPRFDVLIVVPLTTDRNQEWSERSPALYPKLARSSQKEPPGCARPPSVCWIRYAPSEWKGCADTGACSPMRNTDPYTKVSGL